MPSLSHTPHLTEDVHKQHWLISGRPPTGAQGRWVAVSECDVCSLFMYDCGIVPNTKMAQEISG